MLDKCLDKPLPQQFMELFLEVLDICVVNNIHQSKEQKKMLRYLPGDTSTAINCSYLKFI